jgi:hypothetical protein
LPSRTSVSNRRKIKAGGTPDVLVAYPGAVVAPKPYPPGAHPGQDKITVACPDVRDALADPAKLRTLLPDFADAGGEVLTEDVTRDEFARRMAGSDVVHQVNADPGIREVLLLTPDAIMRWLGAGQ